MWAAFTDWRSSFPSADETCKARGISWRSRRIARGTSKCQGGRGTVVVLALRVVVTAKFWRSVIQTVWLQFQDYFPSGVGKPVIEVLAPRPCGPPSRRAE